MTTINKLDLIDIYKTQEPQIENINFSNTLGILTKTDHKLGHKKASKIFQNICDMDYILWKHNTIKLEIKKNLIHNRMLWGTKNAYFYISKITIGNCLDFNYKSLTYQNL